MSFSGMGTLSICLFLCPFTLFGWFHFSKIISNRPTYFRILCPKTSPLITVMLPPLMNVERFQSADLSIICLQFTLLWKTQTNFKLRNVVLKSWDTLIVPSVAPSKKQSCIESTSVADYYYICLKYTKLYLSSFYPFLEVRLVCILVTIQRLSYSLI